MRKRLAILDLGTNTFHLLITEVNEDEFSVLYKEKIPVKIGKGGINEGKITPEACQRALEALHAFAGIIHNLKVDEVQATATSAFRNAENGPQLLSKIKQQTGIKIRTISGDEEAELIFLGALGAIKIGRQPVLVMDIGGGSVEFIIGNDKEILWKRSFEIGAQRLVDKFHKHDPIASEDLNDLFTYLDEELKDLLVEINKHDIKTLVGCSGTFDTLSDIYSQKFNIPKSQDVAEVPFEIESFEKIYQDLIIKDRDERLHIPGMVEMRVDMIVVAVALIHYILKYNRFEQIRVSTFALKEGILFKTMHQHDQFTA